MSQNPLISAYKKPALYVSLPSGGKYYDPKPVLSVDGELAIYPMTAKDELITKTPDALFNGEATVALLTSCCPDIENPRQVPVNDLLVLLLAIRQASYGKDLDVDINCPSCNHMNMLTVDANNLLATVKPVDEKNVVILDNGFEIVVKPFNLEDRTILQIQQVKQQKMIQALNNELVDEEEKSKQFGDTFIELAALTVKLIANCISSVRHSNTADPITDKNLINEWLQNISKKDYDSIREKIDSISESGLDTTMNATCQECSHVWQTNIDLDIANFFVG